MNGYLRQSTAGQVRTVGPFVDDADFKTLENGLTIANTDIVISANGGADTTKNSGGATAHGAGGIYTLTWDATDTATVGELSYSIKVAGALVVFGTYVVLEEAVYDALFASSALGYVANAPVNIAQIGGSTTIDGVSITEFLLRTGAGNAGRRDISGVGPYTIEVFNMSGTLEFTITASNGGGTIVYAA